MRNSASEEVASKEAEEGPSTFSPPGKVSSACESVVTGRTLRRGWHPSSTPLVTGVQLPVFSPARHTIAHAGIGPQLHCDAANLLQKAAWPGAKLRNSRSSAR